MIPAPPIRGEYRDDSRARALYSEGAGIYRIIPRGVAFPADEADVVALVRWAGAHGVPLVPRGAGSAVTGSNVGAGVIADLTRMAPKILEVDAASGTARTSANVRWGELAAEAASYGLRLPPDPSSGPFATLGGLVATNASGAMSLRHGSMRRWAQGLTCITGTGERLMVHRSTRTRFDLPRRSLEQGAAAIRARFPRTSKNSAGYALDAWLESGDAIDLLVGSEGTLAIITEIKWQLAPIPPHRAALHVVLDSLDRLPTAVATLLGFEPVTVELLDRTFLDLVLAGRGSEVVPPGTESLLLVEFEGSSLPELREVVGAAADALDRFAIHTDRITTPERQEAIWRLRHAASPIIADLPAGRRSLQVIEDACVPVARTGEYIEAVRAASERHRVPVIIFGHAGDGNIHVNLIPDTEAPNWEPRVIAMQREVTERVIQLGGTTTGEHGDGRIRSAALGQLYGPEVTALFREVKAAFDPLGILNPDTKRFDDPGVPVSNLKAGTGAQPIAPDIAATLRRIEREGDYFRDRLSFIPGPA